jgi:BirA family transcriptional regulator, biotin operon repressor / biotin---[acetyl-CoA-carboxylase] ligase
MQQVWQRARSFPDMVKPTVPEGYRLFEFDEIDSTNEEARRRASQGDHGPAWILAHAQTAGRGRRGREWVSPRGNLMATLLFAPGCDAPRAAQLSFVAALAVHDTLCTWLPADGVRLKWPNDTLMNGRKISGILLETASAGEAAVLPWIAVGIGINLTFAPQLASYPATFVNEHAEAPDALGALSVLARAWDNRLRAWQSGGFSQTRSDWLQVAAGVGGQVEARLAGETITGVFRTLASDGSLELELPDGQRRTISAGEVFFPDAMR